MAISGTKTKSSERLRPPSCQVGESGFARRGNDAYFTESWVTEALLDAFTIIGPVWECACGRGDMVGVFEAAGYRVIASDIVNGYAPAFEFDFLTGCPIALSTGLIPNAIVTNPPYGVQGKTAVAFLARALEFMRPLGGQVALLLRHDFDSAPRRRHFFEDPTNHFAGKLTLTRRPRWDWWEVERSEHGGRVNYSWYFWDFAHLGPAVPRWGP